ncbi:MAG: hypothetical protein HYV09_02685 [Deltaproteobacteria bacterium]|nr:hypothetical protein [Deltaproteobacteria bacterium]
MIRRAELALLGVAIVTCAPNAFAVRPFITDDARVVGKHQAQIESWARWDEHSQQHWTVAAIGPVAPLELSIGAVHGVAIHDETHRYSLAAPLLQAKLLLHEARSNEWPGVAVIGGSFLPFGFGGFQAPLSGFAYLAATQVIGRDDVLVHTNVGLAGAAVAEPSARTSQELERHARLRFTWGLGTQIHVYRSVNLALETFTGDPYAEVGGGAAQGGFRFILSDNIQLDATGGSGLWGKPQMEAWASAGLRLVSDRLW